MIPEILKHLATHLLSSALEKRVERDALTPPLKADGEEAWTLRHAGAYRALWSVMALVWGAAVAVFVKVSADGSADWRVSLGGLLFAAAFLYSLGVAWDAWVQEVEVSGWGLTERRRGGAVNTFPWGDVVRLEYVSLLEAYRIVPTRGRPVRMSRNIRGIARFKWLARRHAPESAIAGVRERLSDLGRP